MKISCDWLKQYIDITVSPPKLAEKLTSVGLEVGGLEKHGNDTVFEIEITSNRPDWLSLFGIAREIAAVSGIRDIIIPKALPTKAKASMKKPFSIEIQDKDACARYVGRLIRDVVIAPSPLWMQTSLEAVGSRAINNGADITNYCMYETGQPMHAFDFDKLEGGQVIVRRAKKGETIITIDGVKRELDPSILVIADAKKPVAIAGIMGGQETEVTVQTKNILLESAYFDPVIIRRASRKLGLSTESNYRFERKVDIENVLFSSCRAAYLYKELCNGNVDEPFLDACYAKKEIVQLQLSVSTLERLSGMSVPLTKIKSILQSLGFDVIAGKTGINVTVPSFRSDVNIEEDLVEEVARIAGYDTIEEIMPPIKAHVEPACTPQYLCKRKLRELLRAQGLHEVITYSLLSPRNLDDAKTSADNRVSLMNPLSGELAMMRNSLLPSLLKVIATNINRKVEDVRIFELGKIYTQTDYKFKEEEYAALAVNGAAMHNWLDHRRKVCFHDLKGMVENILLHLGISNYAVERAKIDFFVPEQSAGIVVGGKEIAVLGKVHKQVLKNFDISEDVYFSQVHIPSLVMYAQKEYRYAAVPKYPSMIRDIALVVKKEVSSRDAMAIIREVGADLAVNVELFDVYTGDQVPGDCKSLAYSIEYLSRESTLTEDQVNGVHAKVQQALITRLAARLR